MTSPPAAQDAARALAGGDPLRALAIAGRIEGGLGLTLRGIAYAQMGDLELARRSLEQAVAGAADDRTRARARAALVEIELTTGDPGAAARAARASADELDALGDTTNAAMQRLVVARAEVLLGNPAEASRVVDGVLARHLSSDLRAVARLAQAEIATRALKASQARDALRRARRELQGTPHPLLSRAALAMERELSRPIARVILDGVARDADLFAVEDLCRGAVFLVDACRRVASGGRVSVPLARRPVLFGLLLALARGWPAPVARDSLVAAAFGARLVNASHRARLRVEIGRLRALMDGLHAEPMAKGEGYVLSSRRPVAVLVPASDDEATRVAMLLGDGASWSAQGLAEHAGVSKRTVQRALASLLASGGVVRTGRGIATRYAHPAPSLASRMLLLGLLPKR